MGQSCIAIMYGCEVPPGVDLYGEDEGEDFRGVIGHWEERGRRRRAALKVRTFPEGDRYMIGVLAAIGGSGEDGVPYLGDRCEQLSDIADGPGATAARREWDRFAAWAKKEGVEFPAATLWIVPAETA